jgi:hypothetical protein
MKFRCGRTPSNPRAQSLFTPRAKLGGSDSCTDWFTKFRCSRIDCGDYLLDDSRIAPTAHDSQFGLKITAKTKLTTKTGTSDRTPQSSGGRQNVVPLFLVNGQIMQMELLPLFLVNKSMEPHLLPLSRQQADGAASPLSRDQDDGAGIVLFPAFLSMCRMELLSPLFLPSPKHVG